MKRLSLLSTFASTTVLIWGVHGLADGSGMPPDTTYTSPPSVSDPLVQAPPADEQVIQRSTTQTTTVPTNGTVKSTTTREYLSSPDEESTRSSTTTEIIPAPQTEDTGLKTDKDLEKSESGATSEDEESKDGAKNEEGKVEQNVEVLPAPAGAVVAAEAPKVEAPRVPVFRLRPLAGATGVDQQESIAGFDEEGSGGAYGLQMEFGSRWLTLVTGAMYTDTDADIINRRTDTVKELDYWSVPFLAKVNFSGNPSSTIYVTAGVAPLTSNDDFGDEVDLMAQAGIGGAIPLGSNRVSLILEGNYMQLLTRENFDFDFNGYQALGGVSFAF
ncbi:MAG TPA: hypothetical protein VM432_00165 [Bdellovibrionales bacterium]|nr:hypothetical protein [Bdellovibrionales bacterium]